MMKSITRKTPIFWFVLCCLGINVQATSGLLPWVQKPDSLLLPSGTMYRMELLSPEGKSIRRWAIGVKRAALPARLHLDRTRATVNVLGILTLDLS